MPKISGVIIAFNEEKNIERCINSLRKVCDEIIVVDSYSTDRTEEICRSLNVRFFQNPFGGYREQKNYALQFASFDYVLSLDADEALSVELEESILKVKDNLKFDGYYVKRLNNYCGQWIYHSNWYPDWKLRLFKKDKGHWGGINPHDRFELTKKSTSSHLQGDLLHWVLSTYEEHIAKTNNFSTIAAREYYKLGKKSSYLKIILNPSWRFVKAYFLKLGFLDGFNGFVICSLSAHTSFLKYMKLKRLIIESKKKIDKTSNQNNIRIAS